MKLAPLTEIDKAELVEALAPIPTLQALVRQLCIEHDGLRRDILIRDGALDESEKRIAKLEAVVEVARETLERIYSCELTNDAQENWKNSACCHALDAIEGRG